MGLLVQPPMVPGVFQVGMSGPLYPGWYWHTLNCSQGAAWMARAISAVIMI